MKRSTNRFENQHESQLVKKDCRDSVECEDCRCDAHEDKPEPQAKVYFLIDYILERKKYNFLDIS